MSIDVNQTSAVQTCYNCQEKGHMARCALKILFHFFNQTLRDCTGQKKGRDNSGLTCYNCQGSGHMARYNANPLNLKADFFPCAESALDLTCLEELIMVEGKIGGAQGVGVQMLEQALEEEGERLAKGFRYLHFQYF